MSQTLKPTGVDHFGGNLGRQLGVKF